MLEPSDNDIVKMFLVFPLKVLPKRHKVSMKVWKLHQSKSQSGVSDLELILEYHVRIIFGTKPPSLAV